RRVEEAARLRHTVDDFAELPHHFRMFRIPEIQTIGSGERTAARAHDVTARFGGSQIRSLPRVSGPPLAGAIERHGQCFPGALDSNNGSVRTGSYHRVGLDHVIVLLPNPLAAG